MRVLDVNMPESGLVDACKQVKQVAISEADNSEKLEAQRDHLQQTIREVGKLVGEWNKRAAVYATTVCPTSQSEGAEQARMKLTDCANDLAAVVAGTLQALIGETA